MFFRDGNSRLDATRHFQLQVTTTYYLTICCNCNLTFWGLFGTNLQSVYM